MPQGLPHRQGGLLWSPVHQLNREILGVGLGLEYQIPIDGVLSLAAALINLDQVLPSIGNGVEERLVPIIVVQLPLHPLPVSVEEADPVPSPVEVLHAGRLALQGGQKNGVFLQLLPPGQSSTLPRLHVLRVSISKDGI